MDEEIQQEFEQAIDLAKRMRHEVGPSIRDHLDKDEEDMCGYCGQHFGPDDVVIEKEIYGRKWKFCDEQCLSDFMDKSNFKDEELGSADDPETSTDELDTAADDELEYMDEDI